MSFQVGQVLKFQILMLQVRIFVDTTQI